MQSKRSSKKPPLLHSLVFEAIGTRWRIDTAQEIHSELITQVFGTIRAFDIKWSRFRTDSLVTTRSNTTGAITLDTDEEAMLLLYKKLNDMSDGAITPLIGRTLADLGYDARYSLQPQKSVHTTGAWDTVLELQDSTLTFIQPALLDIGAAGKGLLVDRVSALLKQQLQTYTIDAGGDIYVYGHTEKIGLERPDDTSKIIGTVSTYNQALCGSASNRRAWRGYHHIVDARSNTPVESVVASWALSDSAMRADMATTALFFIEPDTLKQFIDTAYVVMYSDGSLRYAKEKEIEIYG